MHFGIFLLALTAGATIHGMALAGAGQAPGHGHGDETTFGVPGDPKKPARLISVAMRETDDGRMLFEPNRIEIKRGEQVRFRIRNKGELDHEFVLATPEQNLKHALEMQKNPDMEHDDPNAKRLSPKQSGEIVWKFTKAGKFDFSCLIPGHRESGMTGTIIVK
ncbi:MAG: copper resistance protein [Alphaproteobacteria bacterium]|nr:copper resistance protein [Alphaproteobacteria bacterium]